MYSYVFAGQGIQKKGMGEKVFAEFPDIMKIVDDILGYSLEEICLENPNQELVIQNMRSLIFF
jgi:malonyl CoA-acyl carrier protein transacylase